MIRLYDEAMSHIEPAEKPSQDWKFLNLGILHLLSENMVKGRPAVFDGTL